MNAVFRSMRSAAVILVSAATGYVLPWLMTYASYWFKQTHPLKDLRLDNELGAFFAKSSTPFGTTRIGFVFDWLIYSAAFCLCIGALVAAWRAKRKPSLGDI